MKEMWQNNNKMPSCEIHLNGYNAITSSNNMQ